MEIPFISRFIEIDGLSVHYLDEGSENDKVFILLHGVPAWSFMYRNIIPILVDKGYRVVCPDLIGFGKSDQLEKASDYTYNRQFSILCSLIRKLDLKNTVVYGQDWGAGFALHLCVENQDVIKGCAISNGLLPTSHLKLPPRLLVWKAFARFSPYIPIGQVISWGCRNPLPRKIKRSYNKSFQKPRNKIPVRALPHWIPRSVNDPIIKDHVKVWEKLQQMETPVLCLFSDRDKFTRGADTFLIEKIPGCNYQQHRRLHGGHFIQEDAPTELANLLVDFAEKITNNTIEQAGEK